jgi:hypothetical protein
MRKPSCRAISPSSSAILPAIACSSEDFAGAVAADQADTLAVVDRQLARSSSGCRP